MRLVAVWLAAGLAVTTSSPYAQFVKGNEAVKMTASGKTVERPLVPASIGPLCSPTAKCLAGSWRMVETSAGLMECTEPQGRDGTCRKSTYGSEKLPRVWVVKKGDKWLQCQYPDLSSKCTDVFARPPANLPYPAVQ